MAAKHFSRAASKIAAPYLFRFLWTGCASEKW